MESPLGFVEEIDCSELKFQEVVGKGAFGVVSRATWRGKNVAVKLIETESEKKAFITELKQLSRVYHPNIVKLYGASSQTPVCLVMEYAEGGSLYNVLHGAGPQPNYTAAHAMSWALQCARGVEYLHGMKPKALIHRDLKPPNLLLIMGGTVLKICDFGTACDIQTHMTNNKGSAAWMAPEVFEGSNYSEKCDVFSWGIILWEIFTRKKPFDEIGGPAFRIMWAVHNGTRPPLIRNLPKPLELLMTRCWSGKPVERPSMADVVRIMSHMFEFFCGADEPLVYPPQTDIDCTDHASKSQPATFSTVSITPGGFPQAHMNPLVVESRSGTMSDTVKLTSNERGEPVLVNHPPHGRTPVVVEEQRGQISAPASLAASRESLVDSRSPRSRTPVDANKRYSADLSKVDDLIMQENTHRVLGHRRSGSYGSPVAVTVALTTSKSHTVLATAGHRRIGSDEYTQLAPCLNTAFQRSASPASSVEISFPHVSTCPGSLSQTVRESPSRSISYPAAKQELAAKSTQWSSEVSGVPVLPTPGPAGYNAEEKTMNMVFLSLDPQLQPLTPCPTSPESMQIYEKHRQLANEYVRIQIEIDCLWQRKQQMIKEFEQEEKNKHRTYHIEEYRQLTAENESLMMLLGNLKKQVEQIRQQQRKKSAVA